MKKNKTKENVKNRDNIDLCPPNNVFVLAMSIFHPNAMKFRVDSAQHKHRQHSAFYFCCAQGTFRTTPSLSMSLLLFTSQSNIKKGRTFHINSVDKSA